MQFTNKAWKIPAENESTDTAQVQQIDDQRSPGFCYYDILRLIFILGRCKILTQDKTEENLLLTKKENHTTF